MLPKQASMVKALRHRDCAEGRPRGNADDGRLRLLLRVRNGAASPRHPRLQHLRAQSTALRWVGPALIIDGTNLRCEPDLSRSAPGGWHPRGRDPADQSRAPGFPVRRPYPASPASAVGAASAGDRILTGVT